jgi:CRP/FNR family transcriptional regulator, dissimilatory nitrate respiration regulator
MDNPASLIERLRTVKHFSHLSQGDLKTIVSSGNIRKFGTGETIFSEGEPSAGMFVLLRGKVHLCKFGPDGQVNIISVIQPVIMINEVATLDGGPNPVTAIAVGDCLFWHIGHTDFQGLITKIPQVGLSLLRILAARNRMMMTHYEDLSFRTVLSRTAKLLLDLSEGGRKTIERKVCSVQEMARRIATVPEAISRSLNIIKGKGLIEVNRMEIRIISVEKLAALAQIIPE